MTKRRVRDYAKEYLQRQAKARREGYRSYGQKRYAKEQRERASIVSREPTRQSRDSLKREAIRNITGQLGDAARPSEVEYNASLMTRQQLAFAATASADQLRSRARRDPIEMPDGTKRNVYWYH